MCATTSRTAAFALAQGGKHCSKVVAIGELVFNLVFELLEDLKDGAFRSANVHTDFVHAVADAIRNHKKDLKQLKTIFLLLRNNVYGQPGSRSRPSRSDHPHTSQNSLIWLKSALQQRDGSMLTPVPRLSVLVND